MNWLLWDEVVDIYIYVLAGICGEVEGGRDVCLLFGGTGFCGEPFVCESFFGADAGGGVVLEEPADELEAEWRLEALADPGLEVDSISVITFAFIFISSVRQGTGSGAMDILFQSEHVLVFWHVYEAGPLIHYLWKQRVRISFTGYKEGKT